MPRLKFGGDQRVRAGGILVGEVGWGKFDVGHRVF